MTASCVPTQQRAQARTKTTAEATTEKDSEHNNGHCTSDHPHSARAISRRELVARMWRTRGPRATLLFDARRLATLRCNSRARTCHHAVGRGAGWRSTSERLAPNRRNATGKRVTSNYPGRFHASGGKHPTNSAMNAATPQLFARYMISHAVKPPLASPRLGGTLVQSRHQARAWPSGSQTPHRKSEAPSRRRRL